jgi:hypothetical protein
MKSSVDKMRSLVEGGYSVQQLAEGKRWGCVVVVPAQSAAVASDMLERESSGISQSVEMVPASKPSRESRRLLTVSADCSMLLLLLPMLVAADFNVDVES